jgi:hypothetical protein
MISTRQTRLSTPMTRRMMRSLAMLAAVFSAITMGGLLTGCGKNDSKSEDAEVRVLHLAPESGTLSLRIEDEDTQWQSGVAFKAITSYKNIANGTKRVRVSNSSGVIVDTSIGFTGQKKQTMIVYGGSSSLGLATLQNDISTSSSGKAKLRLINFSVGLGSYDLYMTTNNEDYRSVEPKVRSTSGTVYEVDTGSYAIKLTSPGTKDVLFELPSRSFDDRKYYNLALYNEGSGELPNAFWVQQDSDTAPEFIASTVTRIRAANGQSAVTNVNINVGGTRVFTNIPFGGISSFARATSGTRTVSFIDSSNGDTVASINDSFEGGRDYSVFLAPNAIAFRTLDRVFPPGSGKTRVRLVNATTIADLGLSLSFSPVTSGVLTRTASNYIEVTAGDGTPVTVTQGAASTPVVNLSGTDLSTGRTYSFVVGGVPGNITLTVRQDN